MDKLTPVQIADAVAVLITEAREASIAAESYAQTNAVVAMLEKLTIAARCSKHALDSLNFENVQGPGYWEASAALSAGAAREIAERISV